MGTNTAGRVLVPAKMEHVGDLLNVERGLLQPDQVRAVEVSDALVDTGAIMLSMPARLIAQLGLTRHRNRRMRTSAGPTEAGIYAAVRLTVQGRDCTVDVCEVPDDCPVLIGQVPLELLDFIVDPVHRTLIGNPEHGGEPMIDCFRTDLGS